MQNNMKKFFKAAAKIKSYKHENIVLFAEFTPEQVFETITNLFYPVTTKICDSQSENGKTVCLILKEGLVEIHELLNKNCTYICFTTSNKKIFEKYQKCLS